MLNRRTYYKLLSLERGLARTSTRRLEREAERETNAKRYMEKIVEDRFSHSRVRAYPSRKWKVLKTRGMPNVDTGKLRAAAISAVRGTYRIRGIVRWNISRIGLPYADFVNKRNPFFWNPDKREMIPANKYAMNRMAKKLRQALKR